MLPKLDKSCFYEQMAAQDYYADLAVNFNL